MSRRRCPICEAGRRTCGRRVAVARRRRVSRERLFAAFFFAVFLFLLYQLYLFLARVPRGPSSGRAILALTFYPLTTLAGAGCSGARARSGGVRPAPGGDRGGDRAVDRSSARCSCARPPGPTSESQEVVARGELHSWSISCAPRAWASSGPRGDRRGRPPADRPVRRAALGARSWMSQPDRRAQPATWPRNVLGTLLNFLLMLVALFFFFRDGDRMAEAIRELVPMEPEHNRRVFGRFYDTLTAVVQSMVLNAVAQGMLGRSRLLDDRRPDVQRLPRLRHRAGVVPARRRSGVRLGRDRRLPGARRRNPAGDRPARCGARSW